MIVFRVRLFSVIGKGFHDGLIYFEWLPLWSSSQSSWLQTQRSQVRFSVLPDFPSSGGSGTGSTQPHEHRWEAIWEKNDGSSLENGCWGSAVLTTHHPHPQKLALTFTDQWRLLSWYSSLADLKSMEFVTVNRVHGSVVGWDTVLQDERSQVWMHWGHWIPPPSPLPIYLSFQPRFGPGVHSSLNRNECQWSFWRWRAAGR
jgi:hypothetical protein